MLGGAEYVVVESLDAVVIKSLSDAGAEAAGLTKIAVIKVTASAAAVSLQVVDEFAMMIVTAKFDGLVLIYFLLNKCGCLLL